MSFQILVFTDRIDFKTLLDIECKGLTGFAPVVKNQPEDFTSFLNLLSEIEIVIIDEPHNHSDMDALLQVVKEKEDGVKNLIILGDEESSEGQTKKFLRKDVDALVTYLKSVIGEDKKSLVGHISVPAASLVHFKVLPFDLYIKLSDTNFVKRINANEDIDEATVESLTAKGIKDLYFEKKYNQDFSRLLINNMINKVERTYLTSGEKLKARSEVFKTTKEIIQSVGLPSKVIEVCETVMGGISEDVMKGKDTFSNYLSEIKSKDQLNFSFQFVELTSFIATQIIQNINSTAQDEDIRKVVFSAFFCDIWLTNEEQLEVRSKGALARLWVEDQKTVNEHALRASGLVEKYKNAPVDAAQIIKEHHGSLTGMGFPEISPNLLDLSKCLMTSQEIAFAILKNQDGPSDKVIQDVSSRFVGTPLEEFFQIFQKSV